MDLLDIIRSSGESGVTAGQIAAQLTKRLINPITRYRVHTYLKELCARGLVYKDGIRYYMKHIVMRDDWSIFSAFINELQYFSNFKELWQDLQLQSIFQKNSLEDMIFQFSNQIGALFSYMMIEALSPTETIKLSQDRKRIAIKFVRDAFSPEYLLQTFMATLPYNFRDRYKIGPLEIVTDEHGNIKKSTIKNSSIAPEINEFYISKNQNPVQDLIHAYNRVYPRFHDLLERGYRNYVNRNREWSTCDHEWEIITIHKIGVGYR
ncbi:MAG: hypothetical protein WCF46_13885, partial [Nitrososphaeraceae archaeon]